MVLLEHSLEIWNNEEILLLLELLKSKKENVKSSDHIVKNINLLMQDIELRKEKCNKILEKEIFLSVESGNVLTEEGLAIRKLAKMEASYNNLYDIAVNKDKMIDQSMNIMANKIEFREGKRNIKQGIFRNIHFKNNNSVKTESIEDKITERNNILRAIKQYSFQLQKLNKIYSDGQMNKKEFLTKSSELEKKINKFNEAKQVYDNMIIAYDKIKKDIEKITNYDIDKIRRKKKSCSYKQYRKYVSEICYKIRLLSKEIMNQKQFLTEGLIESLAQEYNVKTILNEAETIKEEKQENNSYTYSLPSFAM